MKRIITDVLILGLLSIGLGFGANAVRGAKKLDPTKNYFEKSAAKSVKAEIEPTAKHVAPTAQPPAAPPAAPKQATADKPVKKLEHPYQQISFDELAKVFKDPGTKQGLNIFVDARKEDLYAEGHIPGAMHCDPYQVNEHIDDVLDRANGVERVIVYCAGGDCEDSIFMCKELVNNGVPEEAVYLYEGGFKEWSAKNMPVDTGGHD